MDNQLEKIMAEQATGIEQKGTLRIFHKSDPDTPITAEIAMAHLLLDEVIEIPAAGAGSYREVIDMLGLEFESVEDTTSSAGDWSFRLKGGDVLWQSNRYPRFGFSYGLTLNNNCADDY